MAVRGALRHLVTLQNPTEVADLDGGYTTDWDLALVHPSQVYAAIRTATSSDMERFVASTVQSASRLIVEMDYHPDVTTQTRITFGERLLQVTGIENVDERNRYLILACTEVIT